MTVIQAGLSELLPVLKNTKGKLSLNFAQILFVRRLAYSGMQALVLSLRRFMSQESDNRGQTCLHIACSQGAESMVKYLLRNDRCDPYKADQFGNTPLHIASQYGHERVCV